MAHNQRDLAYTDKVQCSSNGFRKKLQRSPSFGDWNSACYDLKPLEGNPDQKEMASNLLIPRKSSRSRNIPAHLKIYECELPLLLQTENAAAHATDQAQQVSDTQLQTFPLLPGVRPTRQSLSINNSLSPTKAFIPRISGSASEAWPRTMKSSESQTKVPVDDSPVHMPIPKKIRAQAPVSESKSSSRIVSHLLVPKKEATHNNDLKDMIRTPSPSNDLIMKKHLDDFFCQICQATCSSKFTFNQHLEGRRHAANLKWSRERRNSSEGFSGNPRCDICQLCCSDECALEMHLKGKKHMNKLRELQLGENAKKVIRCELCLVNCMNETAFHQHIMGKQHAAKVEIARKGLK